MHSRHMRHLVTRYLLVVFVFGSAYDACASDVGEAAAARVRQSSYRDFLDNWLYTLPGDDRGFGAEHDLAQANIVELFTDFGLTVTLEEVPYPGVPSFNVVGTKLGTTYPDQEYIIGAHYDSVHNPGADDNASGVALVLEAARVLTPLDSEYTIRFVAFDREEQGLWGSSEYVNVHSDDDIIGMISADMVAYNRGWDTIEVWGGSRSLGLRDALGEAVILYSDGLNVALFPASCCSDHQPFELAGIPAVLFIEDWGNPNYHTQQDNTRTPDYIDYTFATRATRSVVGFLAEHAGVTIPVADGDYDGDGNVDLYDHSQLGDCFNGPGGPIDPACWVFDFDYDEDIDCEDWLEFILIWTEPTDPPELAQCPVESPLPAPSPLDMRKNRTISFDPNNPDTPVAFRVDLLDRACSESGAHCGFDADCPSGEACVDQSEPVTIGWVGGPCQVPEDTHVPEGTFTSLLVGSMPSLHLFDMPVIHISDCEIQPVRTYSITATNDGIFFRDPLILATILEPVKNGKKWADVVGQRDAVTGEYTAPNQRINVDDVSAILVFLNGKSYRPHVTVLDLSHEVPDYRINADDLSLTLRAFNITEGYPPLKFQVEASGAVHPTDCPVDPTSAVHDKCQ